VRPIRFGSTYHSVSGLGHRYNYGVEALKHGARRQINANDSR